MQDFLSGFHSPLEQSVLKVLIAAGSPAIVVLARPVQGARLPPEWAQPLEKGRMAVVSASAEVSRLTKQRAAERNDVTARLAETIVVAHGSLGGSLSVQVHHWHQQGRVIQRLTER